MPHGLPGTVPGSTPLNTPIDLHRALDDVRHMREFEPPHPNLLDELFKQPWVRELTARLSHQFNEALQHMAHFLSRLKAPGMAHLPENIRDIVSGSIGFIIVLMGLYAFYIVLGWLVRRKQEKIIKTAAEAKVFEQSLLIHSEHHYTQARQAANSGQLEEALRQLYMATLCVLDEQSVVPYQMARTNLEYLEILSQAGNLSQTELKTAFQRLAKQFESSRYGKQAVLPQQFEQSCSDYQTIQQAVASHA